MKGEKGANDQVVIYATWGVCKSVVGKGFRAGFVSKSGSPRLSDDQAS
jgi:hypothetical protein